MGDNYTLKFTALHTSSFDDLGFETVTEKGYSKIEARKNSAIVSTPNCSV